MKRSITVLLTWSAILVAQPPGPPPGGGGMQAGDGIWRRNAVYGEIQTLDTCYGHQPGSGDYHYHASPVCLRAQLDDNIELVRTKRVGGVYREKSGPWKHSPILGWAFDGYPIYGPYAYADPASAASTVRRIRSGYRPRAITQRTSLPTWSLSSHPGVNQTLTSAQYGPAVSGEFPSGRYLEDFEHAAGVGDLDQYNGRFGLTPEFPQGTYAYFVTIEADGTPAFPYLIGSEYYGTNSGGRAATVPTAATTYAGTGIASLSSWATRNNQQAAVVISSYNPAAGAKMIWPTDAPAGARYSGGATAAVLADTQQVRYTDATVYVNANGLASHTMGPWFDPLMTGGDFSNYPRNQSYQMMFPRTPTVAATKTAAGLGTLGLWVNGVSIFNYLDGSSYRNASGTDVGGGAVAATFTNTSSASFEPGPLTPGGLVTAKAIFGAVLANATASAETPTWPTTLGGATVTVKDSAGTSRRAELLYASPAQINYRVPPESATGYGTVTVEVGSKSYTSNISLATVYPHLFVANTEEVAAGQVVRLVNGAQVMDSTVNPIDLGPAGDVYLLLYGSGRGSNTTATATIGGVTATVAFAGAQGTYNGLDQYNILIPRSLAGRGKADIVLTVGGRVTNAVGVTIQ